MGRQGEGGPGRSGFLVSPEEYLKLRGAWEAEASKSTSRRVLLLDCAGGPPCSDPVASFGEVADWIRCPWCHVPNVVPIPAQAIIGVAKGAVTLIVQECSSCPNSVELRIGARTDKAPGQADLRIDGHRFGKELRQVSGPSFLIAPAIWAIFG